MAKKKHPVEMTTDELARHVFHPELLKHAKRNIKALHNSKLKTVKRSK